MMDHKAVRPFFPREDLPHGVGQGGHGTQTVGHCRDAGLGQKQTVEHHVGDLSLGGSHILGVRRENVLRVPPDGLGHGKKRRVFLSAVRSGKQRRGSLGRLHQFQCRHVGFLPRKRVPMR